MNSYNSLSTHCVQDLGPSPVHASTSVYFSRSPLHQALGWGLGTGRQMQQNTITQSSELGRALRRDRGVREQTSKV